MSNEKLGEIETALGPKLAEVKSKLGTNYEASLRSVEIKAGCRYPVNGAARAAWGVIRLKARAGFPATGADLAAFEEAIGKKPAKKAAKKKIKS